MGIASSRHGPRPLRDDLPTGRKTGKLEMIGAAKARHCRQTRYTFICDAGARPRPRHVTGRSSLHRLRQATMLPSKSLKMRRTRLRISAIGVSTKAMHPSQLASWWAIGSAAVLWAPKTAYNRRHAAATGGRSSRASSAEKASARQVV